MSEKILEAITDAQLDALEQTAGYEVFEDLDDAPVTFGELRGLIGRLRSAEKDAARYRFLCDPDGADEISLSVAIDMLNSWSDKSEIDGAVDNAMERQP